MLTVKAYVLLVDSKVLFVNILSFAGSFDGLIKSTFWMVRSPGLLGVSPVLLVKSKVFMVESNPPV